MKTHTVTILAEITEPPKISAGQNHKYDRLVEYFSLKINHQLLNSRIQIEQLHHDQVDGIFPVLKITLP